MNNAKLKALEKMKAEYEAALKKTSREILKEELEQFFEENPNIEAVAWSQYTPYFNYGDPCEFSVNDPYFRVKLSSEVELNDVDDFDSYGEAPDWWSEFDIETSGELVEEFNLNEEDAKTLKSLSKQVKAFAKSLGEIDADLFETAFGDHSQVIAKPKGKFTVSEVEHE